MEFRLLGDVQAWHEGALLDLGGQRQRCVLAVLLLRPGQVVPTSRIVACAWPPDPPLTAADLVTSYISRLRRILRPTGAVRLTARAPGYLADLDPDLIDSQRFSGLIRQAGSDREAYEDDLAVAHLHEALDLWRGNARALADVDSAWLRAQAAVLAGRRLDALGTLARMHLDSGRSSEAVAVLREHAAAHPDHEALAVVLVKALHAAGDPAGAADIAARTAQALRAIGRDPGPDLRRAHTDVLAHRLPVPAPVSRNGSRYQLPVDTRLFTGRVEETERLLELAHPVVEGAGTGVIAAIDGMAGIGKTALAIRLAHRLADQFPDGQLFIDLHGYTQGYAPRTPGEALDALLRALGTAPQQIPQDLDERAALYRERLLGTRTLILLDNADGEPQVRPLLPGAAGCLVLITSRRKLKALDDAHSLSLDLLPMADAIALFRMVAGPGRIAANDPALEEIATLCGYLPLALRIAAALLRHRPAWNLGHLIGQLRDWHHRVASLSDGERDLTAVFTMSYAGLTDAQRHLFRHLGLLPGPDTDAYAAAALIDTDLHSATRLLEGLVDHNLLGQPIQGRYKPHDLIRIHARARTDDETAEDRDAALNRLLDYYLSTAQTANCHLARRTTAYPATIAHPPRHQPDLTTHGQAATWMRTNLADIVACVDFAAAHARPAHTVALAAAMHGYLYIDGPWTYALSLHATAAEAARQSDDRLGQAIALHGLGRVRRLTGDYVGAVEVHLQALDLYRSIGHRLGQANALDSLGRVGWLTGDYPGAARSLEQALQLFTEVGDQLGQAGALNGLGRVRRLTGDYAGAAKAHVQALELCLGKGDLIGQATALNDLGLVRYETGDLRGAAYAQERALELYREMGHRLGQANALNVLGRVWYQTKNFRN